MNKNECIIVISGYFARKNSSWICPIAYRILFKKISDEWSIRSVKKEFQGNERAQSKNMVPSSWSMWQLLSNSPLKWDRGELAGLRETVAKWWPKLLRQAAARLPFFSIAHSVPSKLSWILAKSVNVQTPSLRRSSDFGIFLGPIFPLAEFNQHDRAYAIP